MAVYDTRKLEAALKKKGFVQVNTHHTMFVYCPEGKETTVITKTSHGETQFNESLLSQRKLQMGGLTKAQFLEFMDCPLSKEMFAKHLAEKGCIVRDSPGKS